MEEQIKKLIKKYEKGAEMHERTSNLKRNSSIIKNRASYQMYLCEAIAMDLKDLIKPSVESE